MPRRRHAIHAWIGAVALLLSAPGPDESPSALEKDPSHWIDLLKGAGPELKGWSRAPIPPKGTLNPLSQWSLDPKTHELHCTGKGGHEWLRYDREAADSVFHVEFRYVPVEGKSGYNSGVYTRNSADAAVWHQAQIGSASGGFLFGETRVGGKPKRFNKPAVQKRVKPAGEWNTLEITSRGKQIRLWVNGAETSLLDETDVASGYVGLEAEGYAIDFRNVLLKTLEPSPGQ